MLGYFFTRNVASFQIMPLFWRGVAILELKVNLNVVAGISDGASPNRRFFQLHDCTCFGGTVSDTNIVYKTKNMFSPGSWIWFFADDPHLLKTSRNCLLNSGSGINSRLMWNNGQF